jgi:acyl carrier protein
MTLTKQDLDAFATRICAHFEPRLQDVAEELARHVAGFAGSQAKLLRPETTLDEIVTWAKSDSLDTVEFVMMLEEVFGLTIPDSDATQGGRITFRQLVKYAAIKRGEWQGR